MDRAKFDPNWKPTLIAIDAGDREVFAVEGDASTGRLYVDAIATVTATDLDIRDLDHTQDSVEVRQTTHDNLNANANLQIGNADVDGANPVPVSLSATDNAVLDQIELNQDAQTALLTTIDGDTNSLASIVKLEDAVHSSGDAGVMALAVRNDAHDTTLAGSDGDYSPIAVDSTGRIFTVTGIRGENDTNAEIMEAGSDAVDNGFNQFVVAGFNYVYNGTTWDRLRGDISSGLLVQLSTTDNTVLDNIDSNTDSLAVVGGGTEATALRVTIANNSTGVLSVDDNGGSLTIDQPTHDLLNLNANLQIGDADNSKTNPAYVAAEKATSAGTSTAVTVGTSSTTVIASNANRKAVIIVNDSDETVYLKYGTSAAMNSGIRLNSSGGVVREEMYTGAITGICSSGGKVVTVTEI